MSHQVLYRKWRPTTFDNVVGQEHITKTLKNQILKDKLGHAYLFTGIRGTGKTSTAKIFSRAINCLNNKDGNPCNECSVCKGILDGSIFDITEIDAASNNGVDNIRTIKAEVEYATLATKYKVYIIDEVHMLSAGAFNALLKTLEEPPEYVIFILATTEVQKVPETILSRCQRFDFRRITATDIANYLTKIVSAEKIDIEEQAIMLLADISSGSMRDAISLLERVMCFGEEKITISTITENIGIISLDAMTDILGAVANNDPKSVLEKLNILIKNGKSVPRIIDNMISFMRDMFVVKVSADESLLDYTENTLIKIKENASMFSTERIISIMNHLSELDATIKLSDNAKVALEVLLVKISLPQYDITNDGLLSRIATLEQTEKEVLQKPSTKKEQPPKKEAPPPKVEKTPEIKQGFDTKKYLEEVKNISNRLYSYVCMFAISKEEHKLVLTLNDKNESGVVELVKKEDKELLECAKKIDDSIETVVIRSVEDSIDNKFKGKDSFITIV